ncbi:MAG: hypothetical protein MJ010_04135 [Paludibacteraceae bacterium]|nr:hypothetical protein [Paludibacteraceae bacterium]
MDNLRNVIELLFAKRKVAELLNSVDALSRHNRYEVTSEDEFKEIFFREYPRYSGNQLKSLFDITNDAWSENAILDNGHGAKNVFNVISNLTSQMLVSVGGTPYCRYEEYLRWNEASKLIGEDILVTSFLASLDFKENLQRTDFAWTPYILTTSKELKGIMEHGLSELHNHMKGSSLIFTLNWLAVMNHPRTYGSRQFEILKNFYGDYREILLAAFLRSVLYKKVNDVSDSEIDRYLNDLLAETDKLQYINMNLNDVKNFIDRLRDDSTNAIDYAIPSSMPMHADTVDSRINLIGERKLLYQCFSKVNRETDILFNRMFYLYLIIKAQFRFAVIQVNKDIGFENFIYYDSKKADFLKMLEENTLYKKELVKVGMRLAVQDTYVKNIEYRIAPEDNSVELYNTIKNTDSNAVANISHGFIIHFIKKEDKKRYYEDRIENGLRCRNQDAREMYSRQADDVRHLLAMGNTKIIGVDAANSEFFCRPEVFGPIFRRLRHTHRNTDIDYFKELPPYKLGFTYHVGEDFYDVVDGLRAIEEADIFLNLRNGDRIGHGTALGIDVKHYYDEKFYTVVMPKQVLLDNMVWLLNRVKQCGIQDDTGFLYDEVEYMFHKLCKEIFNREYTVQTYINAWLLRGDEPSLYQAYEEEPERSRILDIYQINKKDIINEARKDTEARELYRNYHYDTLVKSKGSKSEEWKIKSTHRASFVRILNEIQKKMQEEVAYKHISIECNPTSNLRIGNIPKYVNHPIVKFNNYGLERNDGKRDWSAQISVTINTDDAGIFATSLEKEFALMALALEKERDEDGNPKYQQGSVYRWLENIRENAFVQKF